MTDRIPGNLTRSNFKSQQLTIACKHWSQSLASRLLLGIPGDWLDHVLIRDCFVRNFPCCQCIMVQCTWFDKIHCRTHSFQTTNIFMYYLDPLHSHNVNQVLTAETMSPQSNMRCRAPKLACISSYSTFKLCSHFPDRSIPISENGKGFGKTMAR